MYGSGSHISPGTARTKDGPMPLFQRTRGREEKQRESDRTVPIDRLRSNHLSIRSSLLSLTRIPFLRLIGSNSWNSSKGAGPRKPLYSQICYRSKETSRGILNLVINKSSALVRDRITPVTEPASICLR